MLYDPARTQAAHRKHAAVYYAAQAVIGRSLGLPCGGVSIEPSGDLYEAGHAEFGGTERSVEQTLYFLSGGAACRMILNSQTRWDQDELRLMLGDSKLVPRAERLVVTHRAAIEDVAQALVERIHLFSQDIDDILHDGAPKYFRPNLWHRFVALYRAAKIGGPLATDIHYSAELQKVVRGL